MLEFVLAAFLSYGIFNGILLVIFLLTQKDYRMKSNYYLIFLILSLSIAIFEPIIQISGWYKSLPSLIYSSVPLNYLMGPILFFYFKSIIDPQFRISKMDFIHLIPTITIFYFMYDFYFLNPGDKVFYLKNHMEKGAEHIGLNHIIMALAFKTLFFAYLSYSTYHLKNFIQEFKEQSSSANIDSVIHLRQISSYLLFYIFLSILSTIFLFYYKSLYYLVDYGLSIVLSIFIHFILIMILRYPNRFLPTIKETKEKYKSSKLSDEELMTIKEKLLNYIKQEKPYLNPNLKLSDLAERLELNSQVLSQVINFKFNKNFYDFINEFRVEEIKEKFNNNKHMNYSFQGIAEESGFSNYVSFYRVFKKIVGKTPTDYLNEKEKKINPI